MFSGWGMSETAPSATRRIRPIDRPGNIGVPLPDVTLKLIPDEDGRCELRLKGPNVLKGYFATRRNRRRRSTTRATSSPTTP